MEFNENLLAFYSQNILQRAVRKIKNQCSTRKVHSMCFQSEIIPCMSLFQV